MTAVVLQIVSEHTVDNPILAIDIANDPRLNLRGQRESKRARVRALILQIRRNPETQGLIGAIHSKGDQSGYYWLGTPQQREQYRNERIGQLGRLINQERPVIWDKDQGVIAW